MNYIYVVHGGKTEYCDEHVCLSVCLSVCPVACLMTRISTHHKFTAHVASGRGPVFIWRRCDTMCTSGFVDDVVFADNWPGQGHASGRSTESESPEGSTDSTQVSS